MLKKLVLDNVVDVVCKLNKKKKSDIEKENFSLLYKYKINKHTRDALFPSESFKVASRGKLRFDETCSIKSRTKITSPPCGEK